MIILRIGHQSFAIEDEKADDFFALFVNLRPLDAEFKGDRLVYTLSTTPLTIEAQIYPGSVESLAPPADTADEKPQAESAGTAK